MSEPGRERGGVVKITQQPVRSSRLGRYRRRTRRALWLADPTAYEALRSGDASAMHAFAR